MAGVEPRAYLSEAARRAIQWRVASDGTANMPGTQQKTPPAGASGVVSLGSRLGLYARIPRREPIKPSDNRPRVARENVEGSGIGTKAFANATDPLSSKPTLPVV